jgi:hypothetical protein
MIEGSGGEIGRRERRRRKRKTSELIYYLYVRVKTERGVRGVIPR